LTAGISIDIHPVEDPRRETEASKASISLRKELFQTRD
jgi:hypothetical protein